MFIIKENTPENEIGKGTDEKVQKSIVGWLTAQGFTVRTAEDDTSFIQSKLQPEVDKAYKGFTEQVETMVKDLTGVEKNANEKATEFLKRAVDSKLENLTNIETELKTLKEKGIQGNQIAEEYKKQLEALQAKFATAQTEHEKAVGDLKNQMFSGKVRGIIQASLAEIKPKLRTDIDAKLIDDIISARLNKFDSENKPKDFDGMIVFTDDKGETRVSTKDGKPMNAGELLQGYFDDLIDKNRKQGGAGSGTPGGGTPGAGGEFQLPENIKSQVGLHDYLTTEMKLAPNSKEFADIYNKHSATLPLREKV